MKTQQQRAGRGRKVRSNPDPFTLEIDQSEADELAEAVEDKVRTAFMQHRKTVAFPPTVDDIRRAVYSSWLEPGRKRNWHKPSPVVVIVGTENNIGDPFSHKDSHRLFDKVAKTLTADKAFAEAGWDSINSGVQMVWVKPRLLVPNETKSFSYGVLPPKADVMKALGDEDYHMTLRGKDDKKAVLGMRFEDAIDRKAGFDADEMWKGIQTLQRRWERGNEQAGDLASSILETLGFEWI